MCILCRRSYEPLSISIAHSLPHFILTQCKLEPKVSRPINILRHSYTSLEFSWLVHSCLAVGQSSNALPAIDPLGVGNIPVCLSIGLKNVFFGQITLAPTPCRFCTSTILVLAISSINAWSLSSMPDYHLPPTWHFPVHCS